VNTLVITLSCVVAYLAIGLVFIAPRWTARQVESDIRNFGLLADKPGKIEEWRRSAAGFSIAIACVWPFYLAWEWAIDRIVNASPPSTYELKLQNEQQAKRIADLEKELGIGKAS
jgi:hypothetical protein